MIPLAFSTNAFKKHSVQQAIDAIAMAGYAGVELMADIPHVYPPHFDTTARKQLQGTISRGNVQVSNLNAFTLFAEGDTYHPTWIEDDAALRLKRVDHTIRCIELAADFESKTVSLQPGGPLIGTGISRGVASERFADGLRAVLPVARQNGVILAIEPEPGLLIQTSREYLEFKQRFFADEPLVRMNCDIGHLFCVGEDPVQIIRTMPEQIAHIHLEDIAENRVHQHLAPGKGVIDFPQIFAALKEVRYPGWVTVELYPYEDSAARVAQAAYRHLHLLAR